MSDNHDENNTGTEQPAITDRVEAAGVEAAVDEATKQIQQEGMRLDSFISMRTFISADEIAERLRGVPKGEGFTIGFIRGYVRGFEKRESQLQLRQGEGKPPPSIWLRGVFEAESASTGEIHSATWAIIPKQMGEAIADALADSDAVMLDVEIGVEASGKMIPPYFYVVRTYAANRAMAALAAMRSLHNERQEMRQTKQLKASSTPLLSGGGVDPSGTFGEANHKADQALIRDVNNKRKAK